PIMRSRNRNCNGLVARAEENRSKPCRVFQNESFMLSKVKASQSFFRILLHLNIELVVTLNASENVYKRAGRHVASVNSCRVSICRSHCTRKKARLSLNTTQRHDGYQQRPPRFRDEGTTMQQSAVAN